MRHKPCLKSIVVAELASLPALREFIRNYWQVSSSTIIDGKLAGIVCRSFSDEEQVQMKITVSYDCESVVLLIEAPVSGRCIAVTLDEVCEYPLPTMDVLYQTRLRARTDDASSAVPKEGIQYTVDNLDGLGEYLLASWGRETSVRVVAAVVKLMATEPSLRPVSVGSIVFDVVHAGDRAVVMITSSEAPNLALTVAVGHPEDQYHTDLGALLQATGAVPAGTTVVTEPVIEIARFADLPHLASFLRRHWEHDTAHRITLAVDDLHIKHPKLGGVNEDSLEFVVVQRGDYPVIEIECSEHPRLKSMVILDRPEDQPFTDLRKLLAPVAVVTESVTPLESGMLSLSVFKELLHQRLQGDLDAIADGEGDQVVYDQDEAVLMFARALKGKRVRVRVTALETQLRVEFLHRETLVCFSTHCIGRLSVTPKVADQPAISAELGRESPAVARADVRIEMADRSGRDEYTGCEKHRPINPNGNGSRWACVRP